VVLTLPKPLIILSLMVPFQIRAAPQKV